MYLLRNVDTVPTITAIYLRATILTENLHPSLIFHTSRIQWHNNTYLHTYVYLILYIYVQLPNN